MRRAVVTGMGVVSPIGNTLSVFEQSLREGVYGKKDIQGFDASNFPVKQAFEVRDFDSRKHGTHQMDPFIQYAIAAAHDAIEDSHLEIPAIDPYRIGISVSSSKGGVHTLDRYQERFFKNPSAILGARIYANSVPNYGAQWVARRWKINGPAKCYVAACATGTVAVIEGARMIEDGAADYCIAGSSDASIVPVVLGGYRSMKALAPDQMLPFHKNRKGFMVGEGAGIVILETLESAQARGAKIYGEIAAHAYAQDTTHPIHFSEDEHALSYAIRLCLERMGLSAQALDYINLHGTATVTGDLYETREIKEALRSRAHQIPMSSTKSMTGHMLGASGSVEVIATLLAMKKSFLPPTIHLDQPGDECDLDYVANESRPGQIRHALSLSMGFGGQIAVVGLRRI